jgi:hypothetical protein
MKVSLKQSLHVTNERQHMSHTAGLNFQQTKYTLTCLSFQILQIILKCLTLIVILETKYEDK